MNKANMMGEELKSNPLAVSLRAITKMVSLMEIPIISKASLLISNRNTKKLYHFKLLFRHF